MPGAQATGFTLGRVSERLAQYILSTFSFTTLVDRPEDVGHDFLCVLHIPGPDDNKMLYAGQSFGVQVKSNLEPLIFDEDYKRRWIVELEIPFIHCVVDRQATRCDLYSTWNMHRGFLMHGVGLDRPGIDSVKLVPEPLPPPDATMDVIPHPTVVDGVLIVPLGPPIMSLSPTDVSEPERAKAWAALLKEWLDFERANIVRRAMAMYWISGPPTWRVNHSPSTAGRWLLQFYSNPNNLIPDPQYPHRPTVLDNFIKSAVALMNVFGDLHVQAPSILDEGDFTALYSVDRALASFLLHMDDFTIGTWNGAREKLPRPLRKVARPGGAP